MVWEAENISRISTGVCMTDAKWWDFTCPEDRASPDGELMERLDQLCERYVFGHEVGEGGYKHIQGRVVFKGWQGVGNHQETDMRLATDRTLGQDPRAQLRLLRERGPFVRSWEGALRKYALLTLRPWQEQVVDLFESPRGTM